MAKAIIVFKSVNQNGMEFALDYTALLDSNKQINSQVSVTVPANLTPTGANNFLKNQVIAQAQTQFGITLALTDITIIGGAV